MPECRDCAHWKVCNEYRRAFWGHKVQHSSPIVNASADSCIFYKDRSRFVELPCKVGDSYFEIEQYCTERGFYNEPRRTDIIDCEYCDVGGVCDRQYHITEKRFVSLIQIFDYKEKVVDRYNRIFLTKEEAEQALKRRRASNGKL